MNNGQIFDSDAPTPIPNLHTFVGCFRIIMTQNEVSISGNGNELNNINKVLEEWSEDLTERYIKIFCENKWLIFNLHNGCLVENRIGKDFILLDNEFLISNSGILCPIKLPDHLYNFVDSLYTNNNKDYFLIYDPVYKITRAFGEFNKNNSKYLTNSTKSKLLFCLWIFKQPSSDNTLNLPICHYMAKPLIEKYIFPIFAQLI